MCNHDGHFSVESGKWTRCWSNACAGCSSSFFFTLALCLLFSLSFAYKIGTIYASRLLQLHLIPFTLPMSLNSLDREGVRLLSPCDSQIPSETRCRDRWFHSRWFNWAQVGVRWGLRTILCFLSRRSVVVPSWGDRGRCRIWGCSLFWFRSRTLSVTGWM